MWLPQRMRAGEELNAQYTLIFESEDDPVNDGTL
jgi:hypothetical protein